MNTKVSHNSIYGWEIKKEKRATSREVNVTRPSTLIHHDTKNGGKTNVPQKLTPYSAIPEMGDLQLRKVGKGEERNYHKSHLWTILRKAIFYRHKRAYIYKERLLSYH
jgi:hypothetical protein